jgi:hypothetical protein
MSKRFGIIYTWGLLFYVFEGYKVNCNAFAVHEASIANF